MNEKDNLKQELMNMVREKFNYSKPMEYYNFSLLPNLQDYNRADTVNMTPIEMNKFRHIAGSAQSSKDLGLPMSLGLGIFKEINDLRSGDGWADTKYDWGNNMRGWRTHFQNPNLDGDELNDYVFKKYIKSNRK